MSADRWSVCPQCLHRDEQVVLADQATLDAAYGKVPLAQFDAMRAALDARREALADETSDRLTFREDYEFYGLDEHCVTADYSGQCGSCGLKVTFSARYPFTVDVA